MMHAAGIARSLAADFPIGGEDSIVEPALALLASPCATGIVLDIDGGLLA